MPAWAKNLAVIFAGLAFASCTDAGASGAYAGNFRRDLQTVIVGRPSDAISLDPARVTDNESVEVCEQIYDKLVTYHPSSDSIEPALATSWESADHGRVWTFHLREGVTFHDGTPLDAEAVVFSLERQRDPRHPYHRADFFYWQNTYRNIEKVEAIDPHTVRITIMSRYAPFLANLAMFPVAIVSPTAVKKWGDDFGHHPVGTGPFRFVSWDTGRVVLERNPEYWGGPPEVERLVFQTIPDDRQRLVALESGAIDIAYSILPNELQFVELHPQLALYRRPANNVTYLAMNMTHEPFDDPRVRWAINHAVNKEPIVKLAYQGMAIPAVGPLPPTQWGHHEVSTRYPYDPAHARQLLAAAAADGAFDPSQVFSLYVSAAPRPYLPDPESVARVIHANLADVGIRAKLFVQPFADHLESLRNGEHDLALHGWVSDNGDPDNFLYVLFDKDNTTPGRARNVAFFRDPVLHGLLILGQTSESRQEREQIYARAQELIAKMAPWVPIAHSQIVVSARRDIAGIRITASHVYYRDVRRRTRQ